MRFTPKRKTENKPPQLVKAFIHRIKFQNYLEEDAIKKNIADLTTETNETQLPVNLFFTACWPKPYWNFYQQNRWSFIVVQKQ